jgi:hypothetical protein
MGIADSQPAKTATAHRRLAAQAEGGQRERDAIAVPTRIAPAVKRVLPPASQSGARSSTSTRSQRSRAARAAQKAALPPPTTIALYSSMPPLYATSVASFVAVDFKKYYHFS